MPQRFDWTQPTHHYLCVWRIYSDLHFPPENKSPSHVLLNCTFCISKLQPLTSQADFIFDKLPRPEPLSIKSGTKRIKTAYEVTQCTSVYSTYWRKEEKRWTSDKVTVGWASLMHTIGWKLDLIVSRLREIIFLVLYFNTFLKVFINSYFLIDVLMAKEVTKPNISRPSYCHGQLVYSSTKKSLCSW